MTESLVSLIICACLFPFFGLLIAIRIPDGIALPRFSFVMGTLVSVFLASLYFVVNNARNHVLMSFRVYDLRA